MLLFEVEDTLNFSFTSNPTVGSAYIGNPEDNEVFFILKTIDPTKKQALAKQLEGVKVKLTVEIIQDQDYGDQNNAA